KRRNPNLEVLGVVLTCVDTRTNLATELERTVARELPNRAFGTFITQAVALPECSGKGKTLFQLKMYAQHKVTAQYRHWPAEIEPRLWTRGAFRAGTLHELSRVEPTEPQGASAVPTVPLELPRESPLITQE